MAPTQNFHIAENDQVGPHPSFIQVAKPYIFQQKLQECMSATGMPEAKEDNIRLLGVAWIDSVRKALRLPVRTFNTAVVYYHKFRLAQHVDNEYGFLNAAAAALFTACKIEDTLKRSREILCAAYNLKVTPSEQASQDDPMFEETSRSVTGLERMMLEASGFDFRNRHPQKLVLKIAKHYQVDRDTVGKTAYNMSLDLYRTFAPLKQTTPTLAVACVELSGRILEQNIEALENAKTYVKWQITRPQVMETLLDLLDLYTHHRASTIVGQEHSLESFIAIRITLNQEASTNHFPRYTNSAKRKTTTNGIKIASTPRNAKSSISPISPRDPAAKDSSRGSPAMSPAAVAGQKGRAGLKDGTIRFMLDPERARDEKRAVSEYFRIEEEEYEVEVERERERRR